MTSASIMLAAGVFFFAITYAYLRLYGEQVDAFLSRGEITRYSIGFLALLISQIAVFFYLAK